MSAIPSCTCLKPATLIFACSGAADVGELSDRVARQLAKAIAGKMYCLAGLGAGIEAYVKTTKEAGRVLAIDGCPTNCAKQVLERAGIPNFIHVQIAEFGMAKGASPASDQNVAAVVARCVQILKT
jgi:uncharacterized metal-binding protein